MVRRAAVATAMVGALMLGGAGTVLAHDPNGTNGTDNGQRAIADPVDQSFIRGNIADGAFAHGAGGKVLEAWSHNPTCPLHVH